MTPEEQAAAAKAAQAAEIKSILAEALKPVTESLTALAGNQKIFADTLAKLPPAPAAGDATAAAKAAAGADGKTLTADDVAKIVGEKLQSFQQTTQQTEARKNFLASKLKDLPPAYQSQLGNDPAKWDAEEQTIRQQFQSDFKIAGGKTTDVGGKGAGGQTPAQVAAAAAAVDVSKLSATKQIEMGLTQDATAAANPAGAGAAK